MNFKEVRYVMQGAGGGAVGKHKSSGVFLLLEWERLPAKRNEL